MLVANLLLKGAQTMTSHRILQLNAMSTAASGAGMLAARGILPALFGLDSPLLLDLVAVSFLAYAGLMAAVAHRRPVTRQALIAFTVADALWVAASALMLLLFWADFSPVARFLVIAAALVVEVFATLQFRAAGRASAGAPQMA
jgi:CHASE2 domain-containing sensor protein